MLRRALCVFPIQVLGFSQAQAGRRCTEPKRNGPHATKTSACCPAIALHMHPVRRAPLVTRHPPLQLSCTCCPCCLASPPCAKPAPTPYAQSAEGALPTAQLPRPTPAACGCHTPSIHNAPATTGPACPVRGAAHACSAMATSNASSLPPSAPAISMRKSVSPSRVAVMVACSRVVC